MQKYSMNEFCGRFAFSWDMNHDLAFTISDTYLIFKFLWLLPAKVVVAVVHEMPKAATFFEISCATGEEVGGAIFSFFVWLFVFGAIGAALNE